MFSLKNFWSKKIQKLKKNRNKLEKLEKMPSKWKKWKQLDKKFHQNGKIGKILLKNGTNTENSIEKGKWKNSHKIDTAVYRERPVKN